MKTFTLQTSEPGFSNITQQLQSAVQECGIAEGLCVVGCTSPGIGIILSTQDSPLLYKDTLADLERIFPSRKSYAFAGDEDKTASFTKSAFTGPSLDLIIHEGQLCLGHEQGAFLVDYTGHGPHEVFVKCLGEKN